jgi:undecaprenyl diphosphate synthase
LRRLNEKTFSHFLYTNGDPDPDLIIRTGGEIRISNFLLWQISYSELYFTDTLWPDFDEKELDKAIAEYQKRQRRFGK